MSPPLHRQICRWWRLLSCSGGNGSISSHGVISSKMLLKPPWSLIKRNRLDGSCWFEGCNSWNISPLELKIKKSIVLWMGVLGIIIASNLPHEEWLGRRYPVGIGCSAQCQVRQFSPKNSEFFPDGICLVVENCGRSHCRWLSTHKSDSWKLMPSLLTVSVMLVPGGWAQLAPVSNLHSDEGYIVATPAFNNDHVVPYTFVMETFGGMQAGCTKDQNLSMVITVRIILSFFLTQNYLKLKTYHDTQGKYMCRHFEWTKNLNGPLWSGVSPTYLYTD